MKAGEKNTVTEAKCERDPKIRKCYTAFHQIVIPCHILIVTPIGGTTNGLTIDNLCHNLELICSMKV